MTLNLKAQVVVSPGASHLQEFRAMLYDAPQPLPARAATDPDMQVHRRRIGSRQASWLQAPIY
jgi:hypothetical protein